MSEYDEDYYMSEIIIKVGDIKISSFYDYVSELSSDLIAFEAHNGVESGIELKINGTSVNIIINGDWGLVKFEKVLSMEEIATLKSEINNIILQREKFIE